MFEHLSSEPLYNTRAVVHRTGVPADTFRSWERRYGLPRPDRTEGNQRLYSDQDVATIGWLRDQTREGMTISQAVHLFRSDGSGGERSGSRPLSDHQTMAAISGSDRRSPTLARYRDEVLTALIDYDVARADRAVEEAMALGSVEDVCLSLFQPVLEEIGDRWERHEISVSTEHHATSLILRKLGALFNLSRPDVGAGPLVAACLEGELHEVGLLLTSLFLSRRGYRVVYLGPNLPLPDLLAAVERLRPRLVLLSASTTEGAERLIDAADVLAAQHRTGVRQLRRSERGDPGPVIGFGGRPFLRDANLRHRVAGIFLGENGDEALDAVGKVLARDPG